MIEKKTLEEKIEMAEQQYQQIFDQALDGINNSLIELFRGFEDEVLVNVCQKSRQTTGCNEIYSLFGAALTVMKERKPTLWLEIPSLDYYWHDLNISSTAVFVLLYSIPKDEMIKLYEPPLSSHNCDHTYEDVIS